MSAIGPDCGKAAIVVYRFQFSPSKFVIFAKTLACIFIKIFVSRAFFWEIIFEISAETWPWLNSQAKKLLKNRPPQAKFLNTG